jgi:hypothetical protein
MTILLESAQQRDDVRQVTPSGLERIPANAENLSATAMELTDSWGQAMFIMDRALVQRIFSVLGFAEPVAAGVYDKVRLLAYVDHQQHGETPQAEVTWHAMDATCLSLRGVADLGSALAAVDDGTIEDVLKQNLQLFEDLTGTMPDYTHHLMFSPEVASTVMATLGAKVSADRIYELGAAYGRQVTRDLDGRRGVSTEFIRSLTLTLSARI